MGRARAGPGLSLICRASKPVGGAKGSVVFTRAASHHVGDTSPVTHIKHYDQKASKTLMKACSKGRTFGLGVPKPIVTGETGLPQAYGNTLAMSVWRAGQIAKLPP